MILPKLKGFRRFTTGRGFKYNAWPNSQTTSEADRWLQANNETGSM